MSPTVSWTAVHIDGRIIEIIILKPDMPNPSDAFLNLIWIVERVVSLRKYREKKRLVITKREATNKKFSAEIVALEAEQDILKVGFDYSFV